MKIEYINKNTPKLNIKEIDVKILTIYHQYIHLQQKI